MRITLSLPLFVSSFLCKAFGIIKFEVTCLNDFIEVKAHASKEDEFASFTADTLPQIKKHDSCTIEYSFMLDGKFPMEAARIPRNDCWPIHEYKGWKLTTAPVVAANKSLIVLCAYPPADLGIAPYGIALDSEDVTPDFAGAFLEAPGLSAEGLARAASVVEETSWVYLAGVVSATAPQSNDPNAQEGIEHLADIPTATNVTEFPRIVLAIDSVVPHGFVAFPYRCSVQRGDFYWTVLDHMCPADATWDFRVVGPSVVPLIGESTVELPTTDLSRLLISFSPSGLLSPPDDPFESLGKPIMHSVIAKEKMRHLEERNTWAHLLRTETAQNLSHVKTAVTTTPVPSWNSLLSSTEHESNRSLLNPDKGEKRKIADFEYNRTHVECEMLFVPHYMAKDVSKMCSVPSLSSPPVASLVEEPKASVGVNEVSVQNLVKHIGHRCLSRSLTPRRLGATVGQAVAVVPFHFSTSESRLSGDLDYSLFAHNVESDDYAAIEKLRHWVEGETWCDTDDEGETATRAAEIPPPFLGLDADAAAADLADGSVKMRRPGVEAKPNRGPLGLGIGHDVPAERTSINRLVNAYAYGPWMVQWGRDKLDKATAVEVGNDKAFVGAAASVVQKSVDFRTGWRQFLWTISTNEVRREIDIGLSSRNYGVNVDRSQAKYATAVEVFARGFFSGTIFDFTDRLAGQRIRLRPFEFSLTHDWDDYFIPADTGFGTQLFVAWKGISMSVSSDVAEKRVAVTVGVRNSLFGVAHDFNNFVTMAQATVGRGLQINLESDFPDEASAASFVGIGAGFLPRAFIQVGAGLGDDGSGQESFRIQARNLGLGVDVLDLAGQRVFQYAITVGRVTWLWQMNFDPSNIRVPLLFGAPPAQVQEFLDAALPRHTANFRPIGTPKSTPEDT